MSRETKVPAIPDVRDDNLREVLIAIKNTLEVREGHIGDPLDQVVTMRELEALNLADAKATPAVTDAGTVLPVGSVLVPTANNYNPLTDYTTPPQPTGLRATGGFSAVYLEWDGAPYKNPGYTEIWRSQFDVLGSAVMVGTTIASVYADPITVSNTTYYYWIRFVSAAGVVGPYNSTSGTPAVTALNVAAMFPGLEDEIRGLQLFNDLGTRIQQVEFNASLTSNQLGLLKDANAQLSALVSANGSAVLSSQKVNKTQATQITALGTRVGNAESSIVTLQSTTATQATQITSLTTRVGTAESNISTLQTTTADQATSITSLNTRVGTAESNITTLQSTTASQATSITNLTSSVNTNTTSIQTLTTTTNGLSGQYTVKIDNNGHVSGFGLASTTTTSGPTSAFIVRADRFAITGANDTSDPLGTLTPTNVPFVVLTTPTVIGGVTYPAGVWIKTAFIADATISSAKIADLTADKITTGTLTAAIGISTGKIYGGVNTAYNPGTSNFGTGYFLGNAGGSNQFYIGSYANNMLWNGSTLTIKGQVYASSATFQGLTITDNVGNVLLSSGGISGSFVTGLGTLAFQNSVSASNVSGLGTLATANAAFVGSTVRFADGTTMNTGDFVNRLSQITTGNISTFIANGAIGNAYIGNLSAAKITTGSLTAGNDISSSNYVAGSSGWQITGSGSAEFNNVTVRGSLKSASIYTGSKLVDSISGYTLPSVAAVGLAEVNVPSAITPYTGAYMRLYASNYHAQAEIFQRIRGDATATNPFAVTIVATATVNHYFSLWVRLNNGTWQFLTKTVEGANGNGSATLIQVISAYVDAATYIDFGFAATNEFGNLWDSNYPGLEDLSVAIQLTNL